MGSQLSFADARPRKTVAGRALVVLPDAARVEDYLVGRARAQGCVHDRVACTVAELEGFLLSAAQAEGRLPRIASPLALSLVVREVARRTVPHPGPYHRIRGEAGFASAVVGLLGTLEQGLLPPRELSGLVPVLPQPARERLAVLADLLCKVEEELARHGLCSQGAAVRLSLQTLRGGALPGPLSRTSELQFEAVTHWTPLRVELACTLASALARSGGRVRVVLPYASDRPELRESIDATLAAFEAAGAEAPAPDIVLFEPEGSGPLRPFLRNLFAGHRDPLQEKVAVELVSCASPSAEAREVARRCKDLLAAGELAEGIAVAARSLAGGVAEELAAALDRLGVPFRERRGRAALASPAIQLALCLLELEERGFPREDLAGLLDSRLLDLREKGERLPGWEIGKILERAHVRDEGRGGEVCARLDALSERLRNRARAAAGASAGPAARPDAPSHEDLLWRAGRVEEARKRTRRLIEGVRTLPARASLREHARVLLGLLDRWGLRRRLRARSEIEDGPSAEGCPGEALGAAADAALARDQRALAALDAACVDLCAAARSIGREETIVSRADWAQLLRAALAETSLATGGARGNAVQLLDLRELVGRSVSHLFVVGLVDGELPASPRIDPLLSDDDRRALNRAARRTVFRAAVEGPSQRVDEPLQFQLALCAARTSLVLLRPRKDEDGRDLVRSPFVDEAARALDCASGDTGHQALSSLALLRHCREPGELMARAALEAFAEPAWRATLALAPAEATALAVALYRSPLQPRFRLVARAALAERERLRAFVGEGPPGRFSGQLAGPALAAALPSFSYGRALPASANQLEENATCGFRTLGHRLLGITDDDEEDEDLGPKERGKLLHRCLEAYFRRMDLEGRLPLRGGSERDDELATLREVVAAETEIFARTEHVGHRALWELRREEMLRTLADLMGREAESTGRPIEFERRFGYPEDPGWAPLRLPSPDGKDEIWVRGTIDRIDRTSTGFVVADYKAGGRERLRAKLRPAAILSPEFQLPLYAAAVAARNPGAQVDALYISLRDASRTSSLGQVEGLDLAALLELRPEERARLRDRAPPPANLADAVWARVARMRKGTFPAAPLSCDFCDLKPVCRIVALPTREEEPGRG